MVKNKNGSLLNDFSIYSIKKKVIIIYSILVFNKILLKKMIEILLINVWLFQNEHFINITNK